MDKKISILNLTLLLSAGILITWITRIWVIPEYPSRIDGDSLVGSPKSLHEFSANRKTYPASLVSGIMSKNLFRKQRTEFKVALPTSIKASSLPPPEITVRGIMLLSNVRMVVLEGSYFVEGDDGKPKTKQIKKKGYELNDYLGDYQIISIDKNSVSFKGPGGKILVRKLDRKSPTPIVREANLLYYKKKKNDAEKAASKSSPNNKSTDIPVQKFANRKPQDIKQPTQPASIQKSRQTVSHVSGVKQRSVPKGRANISGSKTQPKLPRKAHVSGR